MDCGSANSLSKGKHSDTAQNSGGCSLSCYSDWNLFFFSFLLVGKFCPYKGRFQPIHWAELALWTGRKLHLIRQLQENSVCPVPALPDAGDKARIFQFGQRDLNRPFAPV